MSDPRRQSGSASGCVGLILAVLALTALMGCGSEDIDHTYGKRRGSNGGDSVNGTRVLAEMFEGYGHKVTTRAYLSPKVSDVDVIVWFPDDFAPPTDEQQEFLEQWVSEEPARTLIYVGRDYDASIDYWEKVLPDAPPEQVVELLRRQAKARARHDRARTAMAAEDDCRWFGVRGNEPVRVIGARNENGTTLSGPWSRDGTLDPTQLDIRLQGRLAPLDDPPEGRYGGQFRSHELLAAGEDPLVWKVANSSWDEGKILVVTNGSFLLNLALVEHSHRKLAGKLIAECGGAPRQVVFLESGAGGPPVFEQEPGEDYPTGFEAFTIWPIGPILMHFIVLGLVYLASRMSIFGRPNELPLEPVSDFGHHIEALGKLLERTQNYRYAEQRLEDYGERVRRDYSGGSSNDDQSTIVG